MSVTDAAKYEAKSYFQSVFHQMMMQLVSFSSSSSSSSSSSARILRRGLWAGGVAEGSMHHVSVSRQVHRSIHGDQLSGSCSAIFMSSHVCMTSDTEGNRLELDTITPRSRSIHDASAEQLVGLDAED